MTQLLKEKQAEIAALCENYGISLLGVFGSAARKADFDTATSNIDFLITFTNPEQPGLACRFVRFAEEHEHLLSCPVALGTQASIENSEWNPIVHQGLQILHNEAA